jgi:hypothetical protein
MSDTSGMCQLEGNGSLNLKASSVTNDSFGESIHGELKFPKDVDPTFLIQNI